MVLDERFLRIADRFLDLIKRETGRDTIICNEKGIIVRSSIRSRVGDLHMGAERILRHEVDEYFVTAEEAAANPLIREGMNVPIVVSGRRIASFGIAGTPETSRPLVRVAAVLLANWVEELQRDSTAPQVSSQESRRNFVLWVEAASSPWLRHRDQLAEEFDLTLARNGEECLACARVNLPDAILCDFDDPDLGGEALLGSIRGDAALDSVPFIVLAHDSHDETSARYLRMGADDLVEPSTGAYLKARVEAAVRASRTHRQLLAERRNLESMITHSARGEAQLRAVVESSLDAIVMLGIDERITGMNASAERIFAQPFAEASGKAFLQTLVAPVSRTLVAQAMSRRGQRLGRGNDTGRWEAYGLRRDGQTFPMECNFARIESGIGAGLCAFIRDVTDAQSMELELHQAQKLEAVGRLAAGIAHEINTPIQFIGDNTKFLGNSLDGLLSLLDAYRQAAPPEARERLEQLEEDQDLEYLRQQIPEAISGTLDGVRRVASIVLAMKEFAHPDQLEMVATDINRCLHATIEVARNEYKYVANVETDLAEIPLVICHAGELNQVFLNILVNAAHAVADSVHGTDQKGLIRVATRLVEDQVLVSISDSGSGIPEAVQDRIFEPFFTTKEVGRGTGQGLAIARTILAKHKGSVSFVTQIGKGTTFQLRIPVKSGTPEKKEPPGKVSTT